MDKTQEALKLALEALESCTPGDYSTGHVIEPSYDEQAVEQAITALREALAEQTALLAANKDLQNHFDALMNDYKKLSALCSSQGTRLMEYESSHEPESKPWVGLTDEEVDECYYWKGRQWTTDELVRHVEAKLREKNNG